MADKKDRIITVDGIGYSLDTGKAVGPAASKQAPVKPAASPDKPTNTLDLRHFAPTPPADATPPVEPAAKSGLPKDHQSSASIHPALQPHHNRPKSTRHDDKKLPEVTTVEHAPGQDVSEPHHQVGAGYIKDAISGPFRRRVDRYVVQSILLSTMISPQFWALALLPGLIVRIISVQHYTTADLLSRIRFQLDPANYYRLAMIGTTVLVLGLISAVIAYLVRMVARATRLRELDHRSTSIRLLYRQAMHKSWRALFNWLLNVLLWKIALVLAIYSCWQLASSQVDWLSPTLPASLPLLALIWLLVLTVLAMRFAVSQTMIAATDQSLWFVQGHSLRLSFGSFFKNIIGGLWLLLISLLASALIGLTAWAEVTYLNTSQYLYMQIGFFVLGAVLMLVLLVAYRIWRNMFLAGHYYALASARGRVAMSSYLSSSKPVKTSLTPFIVLTSLLLCLTIAYGAAIYYYRAPARNMMTKLYDRVPVRLEFKIPKP